MGEEGGEGGGVKRFASREGNYDRWVGNREGSARVVWKLYLRFAVLWSELCKSCLKCDFSFKNDFSLSVLLSFFGFCFHLLVSFMCCDRSVSSLFTKRDSDQLATAAVYVFIYGTCSHSHGWSRPLFAFTVYCHHHTWARFFCFFLGGGGGRGKFITKLDRMIRQIVCSRWSSLPRWKSPHKLIVYLRVTSGIFFPVIV